MTLNKEQKAMLWKRKGRRFVKFMFGLVFRSITYFLIFARHRDENGVAVGGIWYPSDKEKELVAKVKADKKAKKMKKAEAKAKIKEAKAKVKESKNVSKDETVTAEVK